MPICYLTLSELVTKPNFSKIELIRDIVAEGLNSRARVLDRNHIVIRIQYSQRQFMLGDVELDIFAQFFIRRFFTRDRRAKFISSRISELLRIDCATWINMSVVGYSRVTKSGDIFYSD